MKIIQLLARIEGSGVTRYVIELNKGLKACGHNVETIVLDSKFKDDDCSGTQGIPFAVKYQYDDDTINHLNDADLVIINSIIDRRAPIRETWIDLVQNKITTRKVIVVNDHKPAGFRAYYGDLLKRADFWNSFDKIISFSYDARVYMEIRKVLGDDIAKEKFGHLQLQYEFDDNVKANWTPAKDKIRRISYLGRHAPFKDNIRLLRGCKSFWAHDYELEMRGIKRTINCAGTPNFVYEFDEDGNFVFDENGKKKPSPYCRFIQNPNKKKPWPENDPNYIITPRDKNVIYVFDAYKREVGLEIIEKSAFACDFFHLDYDGCYGDDFEYTVFEMIEHGAIPLLDWGAGNAIHMYDEKDNNTGKTALELDLGIFIKKDLSNLEECLDRMDYLISHPDEYEKMRNRIYDAFKANCNIKSITQKFLDCCK